MNAILGMTDVALPKAIDPTVQDCLQTAKGSADLLLTLLNDLLDSAKIESGKLELESSPFSLRRVLDQITRVLSLRASEKGLAFNCQSRRNPGRGRRRPDATGASPAQSGRERRQVHRSWRSRDQSARLSARTAAKPAWSVPCRHGNRHPAGQPGASVPAFHPSRRFHGAAFRGHGPGPLDLQEPRRDDGRTHLGRERSGPGSTFHFTLCLPWTKELSSDFEAPRLPPRLRAPHYDPAGRGQPRQSKGGQLHFAGSGPSGRDRRRRTTGNLRNRSTATT